MSIINDILDISKIEAGKLEILPVEYELFSVINDCYNIAKVRAESKFLALKMMIDSELPSCLCGDEVRIRQIINNLLSNAVKYTKEGTVTLTINFEKLSENKITLNISVKDTGIGIREEDLNKLFSSFTRIEEKRNRNIEGTGLGLNLTKKLVEMMGGEIHAKSTYGEGSEFVVWIPQKVINYEPIGDFEKQYQHFVNNSDNHGQKFIAPDAQILVVDDVEINLKVMKGLLKKTHIQIDTAESGMTCLEYVKNKHYDLIFLDHMMPEMDGIETLQKMKLLTTNLNKDTPVIMLTANATRGAKEEYMQAGFTDYLTKPVKEEDLLAKMSEYLGDKIIQQDDEQQDDELQSDVQQDGSQDYEADKDIIQCLEEIPELDVNTGLTYCMDKDFYKDMLKEYIQSEKTASIEQYFESKDWDNYRVLVHALKSTSLTIGAVSLSEKAKALEMAAKDGKEDYILSHHREVMEDYKGLLNTLHEVLE